MYRQYENPYKVERLLHEAQTAYENALKYNPGDVDLLVSLAQEVNDLKERLNFAWQDDEAEMEGIA